MSDGLHLANPVADARALHECFKNMGSGGQFSFAGKRYRQVGRAGADNGLPCLAGRSGDEGVCVAAAKSCWVVVLHGASGMAGECMVVAAEVGKRLRQKDL